MYIIEYILSKSVSESHIDYISISNLFSYDRPSNEEKIAGDG